MQRRGPSEAAPAHAGYPLCDEVFTWPMPSAQQPASGHQNMVISDGFSRLAPLLQFILPVTAR